MFAFLAFLCFLLALLGLDASFDLALLGWMFMSLALIFGTWPINAIPWKRA